ncbi:MAG: nucleoside transporter [Planctomycetota bacterium]|nr:MAG: nucleoside transporter [Planctomycetota bacterium]
MAEVETLAEKKSVFERLDELNEFERTPITDDKLQSGRYFAGMFAGEHVAATEFVIGALFVMWGARTGDVIFGLLLGNLFAVLSWTLVCAPIAVQTRLTLYWYLRQIAGPAVMVIYNVCNAVLYCVLAGCMITVSASAVRIPFNIPPQTGWIPTDPWFVVVVIGVGTVVVLLAILGFKKLAQFATVCSPWMLMMFVAGALMALPLLGHVDSWASFKEVAEKQIWTGPPPVYQTSSVEGHEVVVEFENVHGRLIVVGDAVQAVADDEADAMESGPSINGFKIAAVDNPQSDADFVPAQAKIEGDRVIVWSDDVETPKVVSYTPPATPDGLLCDERRVPVAAFDSIVGNKFEHISFWHIVFFAWICNLAMHLGLSDMALFRYAKKSWYGVYSAFGMYLGHYVAWICAGIMGAAAVKLGSIPLAYLDSGQVAYTVLGWCGVIAVVIAGWTTSNPTLYRAGLALQVVTPGWPRWLVTLAAGAVTTAIACFPFVFRRLLDFVGIYGILLVPVGAIVVVEHWGFPLLGWQRGWAAKRNLTLNVPALIAWVTALVFAVVAWQSGWIHLFFLVIPVWLLTAVVYIVLAGMSGAARKTEETQDAGENVPSTAQTSAGDASTATGSEHSATNGAARTPRLVFGAAALVCLLLSVGLPAAVFAQALEVETAKTGMLVVAIAYFVTGTLYMRYREQPQS